MFSNRVRFPLLLRQLRGLVLCAPVLAVAMSVQEGASQVGEATMVIGAASLVGSDGVLRALERGSVVHVGDRIETQAGGHVHLRFVDGARVSVRPSSRLLIEDYTYARQQPQQTAIKFRLEEGVVRSITGAWGEAARERFRLNTPMAAIGVKGTDFIVRSTPDATLASVYSGAIVLAPMSAGCSVTVGPCLNGSEKLLSDSMRGQMLALNLQQPAPRLVPATEQLAQNAQGHGREAIAKPVSVERAQNDATVDKAVVAEARGANLLSAADVAGLVAVANPPQVKELVWGRYSWTQALDGDDFSRAFEQALLQGRESLGGNGAYSLLRQSAAGGFMPTEPAVNFRLASSAATVLRDEGRTREAALVEAGSLYVDFARATYATQLNVIGPVMGRDIVKAQGNITSSGAMQMTNGNAYMLGGFNTTGSEAAYLFSKSVPAGLLQGITLWGR